MPANRLRRIHPSEKIPLKSVPTLRRIAGGNRVLSAPSAGQPEHAFDRFTTVPPALAPLAASTATVGRRTAVGPGTTVGRGSTVACGRFRQDFRGSKEHAIRRCFFFQAEDGIRGYKVTACALPIYGDAGR